MTNMLFASIWLAWFSHHVMDFCSYIHFFFHLLSSLSILPVTFISPVIYLIRTCVSVIKHSSGISKNPKIFTNISVFCLCFLCYYKPYISTVAFILELLYIWSEFLAWLIKSSFRSLKRTLYLAFRTLYKKKFPLVICFFPVSLSLPSSKL